MDMKRFFLYVSMIAALALAGCGGGGNGVDPAPPPLPPDGCMTGYSMVGDECVKDTPAPTAMNPLAVIIGILSSTDADDPVGSQRALTHGSRPGKDMASTDDDFVVTPGDVDAKPTSLLGTDELFVNAKDDDDVIEPGQFLMQEGSETTLGKFDGSVHVRTGDDDVTDTLRLYANMDDAKAVKYNVYYADGTAAESRDGVTSATDFVPADGTGGVLTLSVGDDTGKPALYSSASFPVGDRQHISYTNDADTPTVDERIFNGMFNGIAGKYACTTECTALNDEDGDLVTLTGAWTFTPSAKDLTKVNIPGVSYDADFLSFGYWVQATEKDGKTTYGVGTFYDGSQPFSGQDDSFGANDFTPLMGKASYSGSAAGMYGRKMLNPDGSVGSLSSGHFTADANLTAYFGGNDVAESMQYTISGEVKNFSDNGGNGMVDNWTVELKQSESFENVTGAATFSGETTGDGTWNGEFFGNPTGVDYDVTDEAAAAYPTGVAGEFNAHFPNGHVIGAFGATR